MASLKPVANPSEDSTQVLQAKLHGFVNFLGDALIGMTSLEVNTMIVPEISGIPFNPIVAYRELYMIPSQLGEHAYFQDRRIPKALQDRYVRLRQRLASDDYHLLIGSSYPANVSLPDPDRDPERVHLLLQNFQFLHSLRRLSELKMALDQSSFDPEKLDMIYAQTSIHLHGEVTNRYHATVLNHIHKDVMLDLHHEGVAYAEKQWQGLLGFVLRLVQNIVNLPPTQLNSAASNGQRQSPPN
jgi:hypothetical protein